MKKKKTRGSPRLAVGPCKPACAHAHSFGIGVAAVTASLLTQGFVPSAKTNG